MAKTQKLYVVGILEDPEERDFDSPAYDETYVFSTKKKAIDFIVNDVLNDSEMDDDERAEEAANIESALRMNQKYTIDDFIYYEILEAKSKID